MSDPSKDPSIEPAETTPSSDQACPTCESPLPPGYSPGLCPACLFQAALGDGETAVDERSDAQPPRARLRYLGDYELEQEIGRGGMGVVYRATQTSLARPVAVKLLIQGRWASEETRRRFQVEARAAASLDHPAIITVHEVGEYEGQPYFSMDLVEGEDLDGLLKRQRPTIDQAVRWLIGICDAVVCAHERGIAHRDLKPSNVIIDQQKLPVVTDFGLARIEQSLPEAAPLTQTGQVFGTPGYLAPERLRGNSTHAFAEDTYALGAILHALLTGHPPLHGLSTWSALSQALEGDLPSLQRLNSEIPADLDAICLKCLARRPEDRYASAAELLQDLKHFQQGMPVVARPIPAWTRSWRWLKRRRRAVAVAVTFALLMTLAIFRNQVAQVAVHFERAEGQKAQDLLADWAEAREQIGRKERTAAAETLRRVARAVDRRPAGQQLVDSRELHRVTLEAWRLPSLEPAWRLPAERPLTFAFSRDGKRLALLQGNGPASDGQIEANGRIQIYDLADGNLQGNEAVLFPPETRPDRLSDPRIPTRQLPAAISATRSDLALVFEPTCGCLQEIAMPEHLRTRVPELQWTWGFSHDVAYVVPSDRPQSASQEQDSAAPSQDLAQIIYLDRQGRRHDFGLYGLPTSLSVGQLVFFNGETLKTAWTRKGVVDDYPSPQKLIHATASGSWGLFAAGERNSTWVHRHGGAERRIPERAQSHQVTSSPEGRLVAILDSNRRRIRIYDAMTPGPESVEINLASGAVAVPFQSSRISPDQRLISLVVDIGNRRRQIQVHRLFDGEHLFTLSDQLSAEWSPDSRFLITSGSLEGEYSVAQDNTGAERANPMNRGLSVWRLEDPVTTLDVHAARRRAEGGTDGVLSLMSVSPEALVADDRFIFLDTSPYLGWSLLGKGKAHYAEDSYLFQRRYLAADEHSYLVDLLKSPKRGGGLVSRMDNPAFRIFRQGGWVTPQPPQTADASRLFVLGIEISPDGRRLWTVGRHRKADGRMSSPPIVPLDVWDAESGEHIERLSAGQAFELVPSPRGDWMAVTGIWTSENGDGSKNARQSGVRIWHSESRSLLAHLPHENLPRGACWDHRGRTLISGTVDGRIKWSRLSSQGEVESSAQSPTELNMVTALAAGDDGLMAAGDSKGQILLFRIDGDQFEEVLGFQGHSSLIRTLEFHAETGALLSGDADGKVRHWDLKDLSEFQRRVLGESTIH